MKLPFGIKPRSALNGIFAGHRTIRRQILLAFLVMSLITASLGLFAVRTLRHEVKLIDQMFDRSLMSINYARAASADFNAIQATFARHIFAQDPATRAALETAMASYHASMDEDLSIAAERAQSERALQAARRVQDAIEAWDQTRHRFGDADGANEKWKALDQNAETVAQQLDLLINFTAGDGFTYRQSAHATIDKDTRFNLIATAMAFALSGLIAFLLARRIIVEIRKASEVAKRIAAGDLDVTVPVGHRDELGALLAAMEIMRGNIKTSMDRAVALRESAQMRLADALESSCDGVVVIDADGLIALANPQASTLLGIAAEPLLVGDGADRLVDRLPAISESVLSHSSLANTCEANLPDGRWLRIGRNATQDGGIIIVCSDITVVKAQQAALKVTNLWLDSALANLTQGLCLFDAHNRLQVFNRQFCDILRLPMDQVAQGMALEAVVELGAVRQNEAEVPKSFAAKLLSRAEHTQDDSKIIRVDDDRSIALVHRALEEGSWLVTYEDVTDRLLAEQKIMFMARHDSLTGLPNRALFAERVENALLAAKRGQGFALLCLDLDNFKHVNDTLGHPFGDELLRVVSMSLKGCIREIDMVARLGGDEFAIVQSNVETAEEASSLARRINDALSMPIDLDGHRLSLGVSIGISLAPADGTTFDKLLKSADVALYKAKADGRNTWRFFESAMDDHLQARRLIELGLREAIEKDQFEIHYQPLFDIGENRIRGAEALLRWRHPERGMVPPSTFISLAEDIGFITKIGDWVLEHACRDAARWPGNISVAINVSAAQFRDGKLVEKVVDVLRATGLPAHRLDLEITEGVLLANNAFTLVALNELRALGVKISMDDFGTGYSSLSYLRSFPFDKVKIDQSFTRDVCSKADSRAIVRTVIGLCRSLGMRTTAEGVETAEQLAFLRAEACHEAQGYHFSRAVPVLEFLSLLGKDRSRIADERSRCFLLQAG